MAYQLIESPFNYRNLCWFCGEPKSTEFCMPHDQHLIVQCVHGELAVPSCRECHTFAYKAEADDIWGVAQYVKQQLLRVYRKDLAIGVNWTPEELANSQFEGGNFESFQRSAWFMYEVARDRVNFRGWSVVIAGITLSPPDTMPNFVFDGVVYPTINDAIEHYANAFYLSKHFLRQTVATIGAEKFSQAVRFCRLLIDATPDERTLALKALKQES
ncbi:hypothetical protein [Thalassotalea fusca]